MSDEENDVEVEVEAYADPVYENETETGYDVEGQEIEDDEIFIEGEDDVDVDGDIAGGDPRKIINPLDSMDGYTVLVTLLVVNIIEFVAAIVFTSNLVGGDANPDFGLGVWALVGGLLSILSVVVMLILKKCNEPLSVRLGPWFSIFLTLLWIAVVMPCTFQKPFAAFGNG